MSGCVLAQLEQFEQMVEAGRHPAVVGEEHQVDPNQVVEQLLERSRKFPLQFPVHTPRLENLLQVMLKVP